MTFDHTDPRWIDEQVALVGHDPGWAAKYREESASLRVLLGPWISGGIHHVGSTAIPGIKAKPVVDILVGVSSLSGSRACIAVLEGDGWWYAPYRPDTMHWFCKPSPARREYHLHVAPTESDWYRDVLMFRDHLIDHPDRVREYEGLKVDLARRFPDDREAYTDGKAAFIRGVLVYARAGR